MISPPAAVFASNYLVTLTALAASLEEIAGVPDPFEALGPLQRATLENVHAVGPAVALTGPAVRGDDLTVERNLRALAEHAPEAVPAYVALAELALGELACGHLKEQLPKSDGQIHDMMRVRLTWFWLAG